MNRILDPVKLVNSSELIDVPYTLGKKLVKSTLYEQREDNAVIFVPKLLPSRKSLIDKKNVKLHIAEYPPLPKKKIRNDKLNSSNLNTLTTKLSKILDLGSTLKEKDFSPFWTPQSKVKSKKLWLPIKTDSVVSILTNRALGIDAISATEAEEQLQSVLARVPTTEHEFVAKARDSERARRMLQMAHKSS